MNKTYLKQAVAAVLRETAEIINAGGPRLTGTEASAKAADRLRESLDGFCDSTTLEPFSVHPGAFLGWIRILVLLYVASLTLLWVGMPGIAALLTTAGVVIMVLQFFLYRAVLDPFYPKRRASNVSGTIEPVGEARQQILVTGHHDSARIFNFFIHQPSWYPIRVMGGIGSVGVMLLTAWLAYTTGTGSSPARPVWLITVYALLTAALSVVLQLWFFAAAGGTPGAGDNLTASCAAVEVGRWAAGLKAEGAGLNHTRVIIISFDAEEAGLRGARSYARSHRRELLALPTWNINADCLYDAESLFFLTSDVNGSVRLSEKLAGDLAEISREGGFQTDTRPIAFLTGGTDAAELARIGAHATTMMGMPWGNSSRSSVYHTPKDTIDAVDSRAVEAFLLTASTFIARMDNDLARGNSDNG